MPARRLSVRKVREILRLKYELGLDNRQISRSCSIPHKKKKEIWLRPTSNTVRIWAGPTAPHPFFLIPPERKDSVGLNRPKVPIDSKAFARFIEF